MSILAPNRFSVRFISIHHTHVDEIGSDLLCALVLVAVSGNNGEVYLEAAIALIFTMNTLLQLQPLIQTSSC